MMEHPVWSCNLGISVSGDVNLTNSQTFPTLSPYNIRIKALSLEQLHVYSDMEHIFLYNLYLTVINTSLVATVVCVIDDSSGTCSCFEVCTIVYAPLPLKCSL